MMQRLIGLVARPTNLPVLPAANIGTVAGRIVAFTTRFVRNSCRAGVPVRYAMLTGKGDAKSVDANAVRAVNWLVARPLGQPARSNSR